MKKILISVFLLGAVIVPAFASAQAVPSITSFTTSSQTSAGQAVTLSWQASGLTDASIDFSCASNAIQFTVKEDGRTVGCDKGGLVYYTNQTGNSISFQPIGNTQTVTVPFTLTLLKNGIPTGVTRTVTVTFSPSVTSITSFTATKLGTANQATSISWSASASTEASIDFDCPSGSIQFYVKEDGRTVGCDKGGLNYYSNQSGNTMTIQPVGNTQSITVPFTLTLLKNGSPTGQTRTVNVSFSPASSPTPTITLFAAKDPNPTNRSVAISWQASGTTDAQLDVVCNSGSIQFSTDKGNYPTCDKGGVWSWSGQSSGSVIMYPSGNTQSLTVDFILTLTNNGSPTNQTQRISVTFPATPVQPATPTITFFGASNQSITSSAFTLSWSASAATDAILEMDCTPGTINFTTSKGNYPTCDKGGVWSWTNQTSDSIVMTPSNNTNPVSVSFTLTLTKNGIPTGQTKTVNVTFPVAKIQTPAPTITFFGAKDPTSTNQSVVISWQASGVVDQATIDVICSASDNLNLYVPDTGGHPICEKGGITYYNNQSSGSVTVKLLGNTKTVPLDFVLTLHKNGVPGDTRTLHTVFPPSQVASITSFTSTNQTSKSVTLQWQASTAIDASLDVVCNVGSIKFTTSKGNYPSCDKGGVWSWTGQTGDSITVYPSGNTQAMNVDFVLKNTPNGAFTPGVSESRTITIKFPASNSNTLPTVVVPPTNSNGATADIDPQGPASSCLSLTSDLRYKSRDAQTNGGVSDLQDFLQSKGYLNSEPTGYFGLLTFQAAKSFQSANGISPTGFVGPFTRAKIKTLTCN